jgi:hypothetical protein
VYQGRPYYYYQDEVGRIIVRRPIVEVHGSVVISLISPKGSAVLTLNSPLLILLLGSFCLAANAQSPAGNPKSVERVRQIILRSRTLGAHGIGYSSQSLNALSRRLTPTDVPTLIDLAADKDLHVGVQFALASQCEAALIPVRGAIGQRKMPFLDADEVMRLIEDFAVCRPEAQQASSAMRSEIHSLSEAEQRRLEEEAKEKAAENDRIQRNAQGAGPGVGQGSDPDGARRSLPGFPQGNGSERRWSDDPGAEGSGPANVLNDGSGGIWQEATKLIFYVA